MLLEKRVQHRFGVNDLVVEIADGDQRIVSKVFGLFADVFGIGVVPAAPVTPPGIRMISYIRNLNM